MEDLKDYIDSLVQLEVHEQLKLNTFAKRAAMIRARPIRSGRDKQVAVHLNRLVGNVASAAHGLIPRERALFVIGESGAGKTFALKQQFEANEAFHRYRNVRTGRMVTPLLTHELRSSVTRKTLAKVLVELLNPDLSIPSRMNEDAIVALLKTQLRERGVLYLHLDEAQHLIKGKDVLSVQNLVKSLLDTEWPVNIILSGVESLSQLLQDDNQLANRSHVMRFERLRFPIDANHLRGWLKSVIEEDCGLVAEEEMMWTAEELLQDTKRKPGFSGDFIHRLIVAGCGAFGTIILLARNACLLALENDRKAVGIRHFARAYEDKYGCLPSDNVFTAKAFDHIDPMNATADMNDGKRKKARNGGKQ